MELYGTLRDHRQTDNEERVAEFVISDETEDRYGTVIKQDGWRVENYLKNPVVLWQHRSTSENPDIIIGRGEIKFEGKKMIGRVFFEEGNDLADTVWRKIQNETVRATSVGFLPIVADWGDEEEGEDPDTFYFYKQELLEFSIVAIPANPNTMKRNFKDYIPDKPKRSFPVRRMKAARDIQKLKI